MAIARKLLMAAGFCGVLILVGTATAAPWSAPVPVPGASASTVLLAPVVETNATGLAVAAWTTGGATYATARAPGGAWTPVRRVAAKVSQYDATTITAGGRTIALALVTGPLAHGSVRVARWTGRNPIPTIDGPAGVGDAAVGAWPSITPNGDVIVVFGRRGGTLEWSTRRALGTWTPRRGLLRGIYGVSVATGGRGVVIATVADNGVTSAIRPTGGAFGAPVTPLTIPGGFVRSIASVVRPYGRPTLLVQEINADGVTGNLVAVTRSAKGVWGGAVPVTASNVALPADNRPAVAVRRGGALVAAWRQVIAGRLQLFASGETTSGGVWRAPVVLSPVSRTLGAPVLATAPSGRTMLAYALNGSVFVRTLRPGTPTWSPAQRVSGAATRCISPSIAFAPSGEATVSFACSAGRRLLTARER